MPITTTGNTESTHLKESGKGSFEDTVLKAAVAIDLLHKAQRIKKNRQGLAGSLVPYQCGEAVVNGKGEMPEPEMWATHLWHWGDAVINCHILTCLFLRLRMPKSLAIARCAYVFWHTSSKKYPAQSVSLIFLQFLSYLNRKHQNGISHEEIFKVANSRLGWYRRCGMNVVNFIISKDLLENRISDGAGLLNPLSSYLVKVEI